MPITLSCTACAKPFRARDESAGKKVKCPYCQAAVVVPDAGPPDPGRAAPPVSRPGASRADLPLPPVSRAGASRAEVALPPPAPKVASADDWGTAPPEPPPVPVAPPPAPTPFPVAGPDRPRPRPAKSPLRTDDPSADAALAEGWNRARGGLGWVRFGLLFVALLGFVELGKAVYAAKVAPLPTGDGAEWVSIEGVVNSAREGALTLPKEHLLDLACYGVPLLLGLLCVAFGRLGASGAPRASGARGLFGLSCLFTIGWVALLACAVWFREAQPLVSRYTAIGFAIAFPLAEFLFLVALAACGLALKRPGAAKAVGLFGVLLALAAVAATLGWDLYARHARPAVLSAEHSMAEAGALAGVWLVLVLAYRRAAGVVRAAAREFVEAVEDKSAPGA